VIDPADTRRVLGMALAVTAKAPVPEPSYGIFRM
jgi:3-methylcrotonyl-CoA carboxylase beta subunit